MKSSNRKNFKYTQNFVALVGITIIIWFLRGLGVLTFIPGGIILLLILLSIAAGILLWLRKRWRF